MPKNEKYISWMTFNNIFPVVTSAVLITISFLALQTKVELLNQKVDMVLARQEEILKKYANIETRYGELSLAVNRIETEHELNRR